MTAPITPAPPRRLTGAVAPALAAAALAGLATMVWVWPRAEGGGAPRGCVLEHVQGFGGPISLVDQNGRQVTQASFSARPTLLYFGFTHCPDACPTTLYALGQVLTGANATVQPVFVSLDPERDTPDVMKAYVATDGFPAGLIGLTGTAAEVRAAADAFRVVYRKAPIAGADPDTYNIDHTSLLYVLDSHWIPRAVMSTPGQSPQDIAACVSAALRAAS